MAAKVFFSADDAAAAAVLDTEKQSQTVGCDRPASQRRKMNTAKTLE